MISSVSKLNNYTTDTAPREIKKSLGQEDFLKLLVTQMQFQDPLKPMDNTEYTAQLAQFSSLNQLSSINDGVQKISSTEGGLNGVQSVNFIGKEINAKGNKIYVGKDATPSVISYNLDNSVSSVEVDISDKDGKGVRTIKLGKQDTGNHSFTWDGKDFNGSPVSEGEYTTAITAKDIKGNTIDVSTNITGTVTGVSFENNVAYLMVGGMKIGVSDVSQVKEVSK
ncbi:MAG: flagellar hook capping FlgD N-terminal domain-containing protein [Nitrospira sp.]|nr:flagellar hook capping FlgD N-terminal domain-containing protein [Nitrospira sp.]